MIKKFITTEKSVRIVEAENALLAEVEKSAQKSKLKKVFERDFKVKVEAIRTYIKDNKKYAYIKLDKKNPAIDIATKFGVL